MSSNYWNCFVLGRERVSHFMGMGFAEKVHKKGNANRNLTRKILLRDRCVRKIQRISKLLPRQRGVVVATV